MGLTDNGIPTTQKRQNPEPSNAVNSYTELKKRHQEEVDAFPFFFAFSNEQFAKGMERFGLTPDDTDKIYKLGNTGGFYLRTDAERLHEMFDRHAADMQNAIDADTTGEGFIFEMFMYELANHEYTYTNDLTDTLEALDLTPQDIEGSETLKHGLLKAIKASRDEQD